MKTFAEQWMASRGQPIPFEGKLVHGIWRIPLVAGEGVAIRFVSWTPDMPQGLRMSLDTAKGRLVVGGEEIREVVLWTETAPARPIVLLPKAQRRPQVLAVWNVWRGGGPSSCDAWIGNCGMIVEEDAPNLRLRCSDGVGPPNFEDLVVEISRVSVRDDETPTAPPVTMGGR